MKRFDVMCSGKQMMSSATSQEKQVVAKIMELLKEWEFIYYLLHLSRKTRSYHILHWSCRHTGRNPYAKPHPLQRSNTDVGTATKPMTSASRADGNAPFTYIRLLSPETRSTRWQQQTWHHLPTYKNDNPIYNKSAVYRDAYPAPYRHWNIHPDWELKQNSWRTVRATVSIRASYCSELVFRYKFQGSIPLTYLLYFLLLWDWYVYACLRVNATIFGPHWEPICYIPFIVLIWMHSLNQYHMN